LKGNVKLKTLKKNGDFLYADNFIWNIEKTNTHKNKTNFFIKKIYLILLLYANKGI